MGPIVGVIQPQQIPLFAASHHLFDLSPDIFVFSQQTGRLADPPLLSIIVQSNVCRGRHCML